MRSKYAAHIQNERLTPVLDFIESYNRTLPAGFPRATAKTVKLFQQAYPALFKGKDEWSIDKHRKRFMDWLASHPTEH